MWRKLDTEYRCLKLHLVPQYLHSYPSFPRFGFAVSDKVAMNVHGFQEARDLMYLHERVLRLGRREQVAQSLEYFQRAAFVAWDHTEIKT